MASFLGVVCTSEGWVSTDLALAQSVEESQEREDGGTGKASTANFAAVVAAGNVTRRQKMSQSYQINSNIPICAMVDRFSSSLRQLQQQRKHFLFKRS